MLERVSTGGFYRYFFNIAVKLLSGNRLYRYIALKILSEKNLQIPGYLPINTAI